MIYQPIAGDIWSEDVVQKAGLALLALLLFSESPEVPARASKLTAKADHPVPQVSTAIAAVETPKTAECQECKRLRDELSHLKLDLDFQKGEIALKEDGLNELRGVLDGYDVPTGPVKARLERVCKDRDDARKRALAAENEARTLRARVSQLERGEQTDDPTAQRKTGTTNHQQAAGERDRARQQPARKTTG